MAKKTPEEFSILSPEEEYESYVQQQIADAEHKNEKDKIELYKDALQFGLKVLKELK